MDEIFSPTVSVDKITTAPIEVPNAGDLTVAKQESEFLHQQEYFKKELGWLGKPFGGRAEKPGNISALVVVLCFTGMGLVFFFPKLLGEGFSVKDAWQSLMSVVTLILGYLFGSNDRPHK